MNIAQVARYLGVSYSGIRLLYEASEYPVVQRQAPGSGVEPYDAYLRERWAAGCHNALQLHRELMAQGYTGSRVTVSRYIYPWRQTDGIIVNGALISSFSLRLPKRKIPTARASVWILLKAESNLAQEERQSRTVPAWSEQWRGHSIVAGFLSRHALGLPQRLPPYANGARTRSRFATAYDRGSSKQKPRGRIRLVGRVPTPNESRPVGVPICTTLRFRCRSRSLVYRSRIMRERNCNQWSKAHSSWAMTKKRRKSQGGA